MLFIYLLILLTVVALPQLHVFSYLATRLTVIVLIFTSILVYHTNSFLVIEKGVSIFTNNIHVTPESYIIDIVIGIISSICLIPWINLSFFANLNKKSDNINFLKNNNNQPEIINNIIPENTYYSLIVIFSVIGSILIISSQNLIIIYLSLELQSFSVYSLAAIYRNSQSATNAGLTYFLLGGLSSCFILFGSADIYSNLGIVNLDDIFGIQNNNNISNLSIFSIVLIISGLSFKIAAAPFYQWAPDVYDRVPTIVTTWLQTIPKLAVIGIFLKFTTGLNNEIGWIQTIILVSFISLVIGSIIGLSETRIKRLLTYSTITHVGFILLALTAYNIDSISAFLFYLVQYSLTSLAAFLILLALGYVIGYKNNNNRQHKTDIELVSEFTGIFINYPFICVAIASILFSIIGVPPFVGFIAKQNVLEASLIAHSGGITIIAIIVSVISGSYYLKILDIIYFKKPINIQNTQITTEKSIAITSEHTFSISLIVIFVSFYMILPSFILDSTREMAIIIYT